MSGKTVLFHLEQLVNTFAFAFGLGPTVAWFPRTRKLLPLANPLGVSANKNADV